MLKKLWKKYKGKIPAMLLSIAIPLGVGILSALLTKGNMSIFEQIKKPPLSPPAFLFPIVWSILYILMGISAFLIYDDRTEENKGRVNEALTYYFASLIFNFLWSILFFNFKVFGIAAVCLAVLLVLILKTILSYFKINRTAAYLQIPYALWVAFAGYLNVAISIIN